MADAAAATASAASFAGLLEKLDYLGPASIEMVRQAYHFADKAHLGQMRNSGDPYITHPIAVAVQCASWKLDAQALMAALLHDAMEDCGVTKADLAERFGISVAELVDGLTKLDKLQFNTREENQAESFRKMLLAMARDVRVILIAGSTARIICARCPICLVANGAHFFLKRWKFMHHCPPLG